jgi:hypothetical protein
MGLSTYEERNNYSLPFSRFTSFGFGTLDTQFMLLDMLKDGHNLSSSPMTTVILANTPQLLVSFIYLSYNSIWTSMFRSLEWSLFAQTHKALRVSYPEGDQRSTYRLQIPYRYGVSLMILIGTIHWLISESFFPARVNVYDSEDGHHDKESSLSTCGYSLPALATTIIVGVIALLILVGVGILRRFDSGTTLVSSNSAAISAACHPKSDEPENAHLLPLQWGVVTVNVDPDGAQIGHCSFSSEAVSHPHDGGLYR